MLSGLSCREGSQAEFVEIVGLNPDNPYEFMLKTERLFPVDPYRLQTDAIHFVAKARVQRDVITELATMSPNIEQLAKDLRASMGFFPLNLEILFVDNVVRAQTFSSLLALSAFHHLNVILQFSKTHLGDLYRPSSSLLVAMYGEIELAKKYPIPIVSANNAVYVSTADAIFLLPTNLDKGLPLSMHEGVLAHEFHHRIFFDIVWNNPALSNLWPLYKSRFGDKNLLEKRSQIILSALDEGLADLFAVAFTGLPDFLLVSLPEERLASVRNQRDLNGQFAKTATYDNLASGTLDPKLFELCGKESNDFKSDKFDFYCLGTVIARAIFVSVDEDFTSLKTMALPIVARALKVLSAEINKGREIDLDIFFNAMAADADGRSKDFKKKLCAQMTLRFTSIATATRMPSCVDVW